MIRACEIVGLYKKARAGEIENFTGLTSPFETPVKPSYIVSTHDKSAEESVNEVLEFVLPHIKNWI